MTPTEDLSIQLTDRAATIAPQRPPSATIVSRSRQSTRRRHRTFTAVIAVTTLTVLVAGLAIAGPLGRRDGSVDSVGAPPSGTQLPPLHMGLGVADQILFASAIRTSDSSTNTLPPVALSPLSPSSAGPRPPVVAEDPTGSSPVVTARGGSSRTYEDPRTGRKLSIAVVGTPGTSGTNLPNGATGTTVLPGERVVDLGNGRTATLYYGHGSATSGSSAPGEGGPETEVFAYDGNVEIILTASGLTDDELVATVRTVTVADDGETFDAPDVPTDLLAGPVEISPLSPEALLQHSVVQSDITYQLPDETRAGITVMSDDGGQRFKDMLAKAGSAPTAEVFAIPAQGTTALVHRQGRPGVDDIMVDVSWIEPGGHLVTISANSSHSSATTDPGSLAARARPLSDAEYQSILDQFGH